MLSEFGKFCRKLRIEKNELLINMAQKLNVKPSFLSAVEVGKKSIPEKWKDEIVEKYDLSQEQEEELVEAIENSVRQIKFDLTQNEENRDLLLAFARKLDILDTNEKESIVDILRMKIFPLDSSDYFYKVKIIEFLKKNGIDYYKTPVPDWIVDKIKNKYPNTWIVKY